MSYVNFDVECQTELDDFGKVEEFHQKFSLERSEPGSGHVLSPREQVFRVEFLAEELLEYCRAVGLELSIEDGEVCVLPTDDPFDAAKAFDAMLDLTYVAMGTAHKHRFPWREGMRRVHDANMKKVEVPGIKKVGKPPGWVAPTFDDLLEKKKESE